MSFYWGINIQVLNDYTFSRIKLICGRCIVSIVIPNKFLYIAY